MRSAIPNPVTRSRWLRAAALAGAAAATCIALGSIALAATPSKAPATSQVTATPSATPTAPVNPGVVTYRRVRGQTTGGFQVSPSRITESKSIGSTATDVLIVLNQSGLRKRFKLDVRDLAPGHGDGYGILVDAGTQVDSAAKWVQPTVREVVLDNLQEAQIPVSITVPAQAGPGGHYAGIVVSMSDEAETKVRVTTQIVSDVVMIIPGDIRYRAKLTDVSLPRFARKSVVTTATIVNTGNIHTAPHVKLVFRGTSRGATLEEDIPETLPAGTRTMRLTWQHPPAFGHFTPKVSISTEDGRIISRTLPGIWIWSWQVVAAAAALPLVLLVIIVLWVRRRRHWQRVLAEFDEAYPDD